MSEQKTRVLIDQHGHTLQVVDDEFYTLQAERDALAAQVEAFKEELNKCVVNGVPLLRVSQTLKSLVASASTEVLAAHDAEVAKAAFIEGARQAAHNEIGWFGYGVNECAELYSSGLNK